MTTTARVTGVIDASTLEVRLAAGEVVKVGLVGVDGPDRGAPGTRGDCGARDAVARMKRLAFRNGIGRIVRLRTDPTQGRAGRSRGRLLAYVEARAVDFGRTMISSGLAKVQLERDFVREPTYRKAEASARAARRGVWRRCGGNPTVR